MNFIPRLRKIAVAAVVIFGVSPTASAASFVIYNSRGAAISLGSGHHICPVWGCVEPPIVIHPPIVVNPPIIVDPPIFPIEPPIIIGPPVVGNPPIHICPVWGCNGPRRPILVSY